MHKQGGRDNYLRVYDAFFARAAETARSIMSPEELQEMYRKGKQTSIADFEKYGAMSPAELEQASKELGDIIQQTSTIPNDESDKDDLRSLNLHELLNKLIIRMQIVFGDSERRLATEISLILKKIASMTKDELEQRDGDKRTALHLAMLTHQKSIVKAIIAKGVNIELLDKTPETPLGLALTQLGTRQWNDSNYTSAIQFLLYEAHASRTNLDEAAKDILSKLESVNWQSHAQRRAMETHKKWESEKAACLQEFQDIVENNAQREKDFILNGIKSPSLANKQRYTVEELVTDSIVLDKQAPVVTHDKFHRIVRSALKKLTEQHPIAARILYLHARARLQELGLNNPCYVLVILGKKVDGIYKAIDARGIYTNKNVTAIAVESIEGFLSECEAYASGSSSIPPVALSNMMHEILHHRLHDYFKNSCDIYYPEHENEENLKLARGINEAFKSDFDHATLYHANNKDNPNVVKIFDTIVCVITRDYFESSRTKEIPCYYLNAYLEVGDPSLLETMFPLTTKIVFFTLDKMDAQCKKDFPNSQVEESYQGLLETPSEKDFNAKVKSAFDRGREAAQKKSSESMTNLTQSGALRSGFFLPEDINEKVIKHLKRITEKLQLLDWQFSNDKNRFWCYVDRDLAGMIKKYFDEQGLLVGSGTSALDGKTILHMAPPSLEALQKITEISSQVTSPSPPL